MLRFTPLAGLLLAGTAYAGDKPIYAPAPTWVTPAPPMDPAQHDDSPAIVRFDAQQRLQDGGLHGFIDTIAHITSDQALASAGTITLPWQPDKGDLTIHAVEIIRGTQHIDLIAAGQRFQVLHREAQLEQRMLNGVLTATMAVEGLRVGDSLRVSFSITQADPALGGNMQLLTPLPTAPFPAQFARARVIWPEAVNLHWKLNVTGVKSAETTANGYHEITYALPLEKRPDLPSDAPVRYKLPPILEASTFADWAAISTTMAPLYKTEGSIAPGSPLATEVATIMAAAPDPLHRAALALTLVQSKVRYLFKGMDGGNYVPQTPTQTWSARYGDCKAKTLLLLAMLQQMGIEAEPVMASSQLSDALPVRLPTPGAFDHVFVKATIAGETLWLDGTGSGSEFADIHDTPPMRFVLPVRASGAGLFDIAQRRSNRPNASASIDLDESAGVNFPAPYKLSLTVRGQSAQVLKAISVQGDKDKLTELATTLAGNYLDSPAIVTRVLTFDDMAGTATLKATGIAYPGWTKESDRYRGTLDTIVSNLSFDPDRSKAAWHDIPVSIGNADHVVVSSRITLPTGGKGYELDGNAVLRDTLAGIQIDRKAALVGGVLTVDTDQSSTGAEIAVADIGAARQKLSQAKQHLLRVVAPTDLPPSWQTVQAGKRTRAFEPVLVLYKQAIVAEPTKAEPLTNRAWFLDRLYERRLAIDDISRALVIEPTVSSYLWRAKLSAALGERDKAIADVLAARKIDPASYDAIDQLASLYADKGDTAQALALLDARIDEGGKDKTSYMAAKALIQAYARQADPALTTIEAALAAKPRDADLLNTRCWIKAILNTAVDTALKDCTKSIELSDSPESALDSRAMAYFRLNRLDDATADLNAALDISPDIASSLFLRAIIRKQGGDAVASAADAAGARLISPMIDTQFARYGLKL